MKLPHGKVQNGIHNWYPTSTSPVVVPKSEALNFLLKKLFFTIFTDKVWPRELAAKKDYKREHDGNNNRAVVANVNEGNENGGTSKSVDENQRQKVTESE